MKCGRINLAPFHLEMSHGPIVAVEGGGMEDSWMAENAEEEDKFAPSSCVKKEEEGGSILNQRGRRRSITGMQDSK